MKEIYRWGFNIAVLILLAALLIISLNQSRDPGQYDFCVEYVDITRDNIIWKAYNFKHQKINWDWEMNEDVLYKINISTGEILEQVPCTRKVKSIILTDQLEKYIFELP